MSDEIFKQIKNYEGLYEISNFGRIKSIERITKCKNGVLKKNQGRFLSFSKSTFGHNSVTLCKDGVYKMHPVHRLVAFHFLVNFELLGEEKYIIVSHKDKNILNNNAENLFFKYKKRKIKAH